MQPRNRGRPRMRTCCDCGREDLVRSDNKAERCVSCSARLRGARGLQVIRAKRPHAHCECCGRVFVTTPSALAHGRVRFCSRECSRLARRVERNCRSCGAAFVILRSALSASINSSGRFCSRGCYHTYLCRTQRVTGRGSRWRLARTVALRRAPFCALCGKLRSLDVHHIIPFRITRDNSQPNLIPLCKRHHKLIETIQHDVEATDLDLPTFQLWFRNALTEWQSATRFVLTRMNGLHSAQYLTRP